MSSSHNARKEPTLNAPPLLTRMTFDNVRDAPYVPAPSKPIRYLPWLLLLFILSLAAAIYYESRTHYYQSHFWHFLAKHLTYDVIQNESDNVRYAKEGPFDIRFGYSALPFWREKLKQSGFDITQQTQFSEHLLRYTDYGFYPPFSEKSHAGLVINDCKFEPIYQTHSPSFQFSSLDEVSPLIIKSLLFVEDRSLLTPHHADANPVINFTRLGAAIFSQIQKAMGQPAQAAGGSTLATQLEKYRHSPQGLTSSIAEKFTQVVSASVKVYQSGLNTEKARHKIALDYINTVPLAATPSYGEVHGIAEALHAWFGVDPMRINRLLNQGAPYSNAQALALKQVMALIIAQRRPSYYLLQGRDDLERLSESHLSLMSQQGVIPSSLAQKAIKQKLSFNTQANSPAVLGSDFKATTMARNRLSSLLEQNLYQLDRLDLTAQSTIYHKLQQDVSQHLHSLNLQGPAEQAGLFAERLLQVGQQNKVRYSFTLYQSTLDGNKVRVQTDNTGQPFDMNDASKLELGSTAKLRVLVTYLQIVAELHRLYAEETPESLTYVQLASEDKLSNWAINYISANPGVSLQTMLQAALERRYSADPKASFYTGGGLHTFNNFRKEENALNPTIAEALQQSINLPFVRLLQDIVNYSIYHGENSSYQLLNDDENPRRDQYLRRFADKEGTTFLHRFWQKYKNSNAADRLALYIKSAKQTPERLAIAYRYIHPNHSLEQFSHAMSSQFGEKTSEEQSWKNLYDKYQPDAFSLPDIAYLSRSHPLELWLLAYLNTTPDASIQSAITDSAVERQDIYQWLFKTRFKSARDNRIRNMLEIEAFWDIHQRWQRLGYPFDYLVPSLATALGSSGDRPSALAELTGIILNNGKHKPTIRLDKLEFANNTPYETHFMRAKSQALQVLEPEVAQAVKHALLQVTTLGTARRLQPAYGASMLPIGGKTGTGDNRVVQVDSRGNQISSKSLNRTATFTFYLGEHHFGVLTAYVADSSDEKFSFTSALPLQVMNSMAPILLPYLTEQNWCN